MPNPTLQQFLQFWEDLGNREHAGSNFMLHVNSNDSTGVEIWIMPVWASNAGEHGRYMNFKVTGDKTAAVMEESNV